MVCGSPPACYRVNHPALVDHGLCLWAVAAMWAKGVATALYCFRCPRLPFRVSPDLGVPSGHRGFQGGEQAWWLRWGAMLFCAAAKAFASSLLESRTAGVLTNKPKARHSKWKCSEPPQQTSANQKRATNRRNQKPLLQNNQERTYRNTTDTMEGPETTTTTPFAR